MDDRMRSMSETGRQAADEAEATVSRATTRIQERAADLGERARHTAAEAGDRLARATDQVREPLGEWAEQARHYVRTHPIQAVAITVGAGFLLGKLLRRG